PRGVSSRTNRPRPVSPYDITIPLPEWRRRQAAHRARVRPWVEDRTRRAGRGEKHPVYDFLFEYYSFRPSYLARWSPGVGVRLERAGRGGREWGPPVAECGGGDGL